MKARLPKMLLAALLAAFSTAYAAHQYYQGTWTTDNVDVFANTDPASTVNIGYGDTTQAYNAVITLDGANCTGGKYFTTPNALFIGGPGWPHTVSEGYKPSAATFALDNGAALKVGVLNPGNPSATHITMGSCNGANSLLFVRGGSKIEAGSLEVSIGGGYADVYIGSDAYGDGFVDLTGDLKVGMNQVDGAIGYGSVTIYGGSRVTVAGVTAVGAAAPTGTYTLGGDGFVEVLQGAVLNTGSLEIGVGVTGDGSGSYGDVRVNGTLNVADPSTPILIGYDGGEGTLWIFDGGTANLNTAEIRLGSSNVQGDGTNGQIIMYEGGTLNHAGTMLVGEIDPEYGTGAVWINEGATARLKNVEVSAGSKIWVDGDVSVNETPWGDVNAPGVHLYHNSWVGGAPKGAKLTLVSIKEIGDPTADIHMLAEGLTLTKGTTFEACCDTHMKVNADAFLKFGEGVMHLTDGVLFIDSEQGEAGLISTTAGTGNVSIAGNTVLENKLSQLIRRDETSRLGIIDAADLINNGGTCTDFTTGGHKLKLIDNSAYEVRFTETGVTVINDEYGQDDFQGFYLVKTGNPAEDGYYQLDRNEKTVYNVIDQLDREGAQIPEDLKNAINAVLNIDGKKNLQELRQALDFLGTVNYSVMMHNQIDGNTSHQRMLRNRSMVGRNLRHRKGCTDVYAAAFFDTQRNNYGFHTGQGYHRTEWGGLVGADTCINQYLRLGADVAYGRARINPTQNWAMHQNSLYWDVYAQFRKGNWRSITALGMGIHSFDLKRGLGSLSAKANNVKGYSLNFTEEVSYDWKVSDKTTIQPFAALDLNWNTIKSFTDGDVGSMNMHVKRQRALAADLTVGGRYIRDFALLRNVPDATWYAQLGVTVSMGQRDCDMDCNFVGAPDAPFTIYAAKRDRVGLDLGAGITIPVTDRWAVFANGEAILRGDSHNINAQIGVQVAF